jgi:hypothetical protein
MVAAACLAADTTHGESELSLHGCADLLSRYFNERESLIPPALITGRELVARTGRAPGPWVGRVLARVRQAQIEETIVTAADALGLALDLAATAADSASAPPV